MKSNRKALCCVIAILLAVSCLPFTSFASSIAGTHPWSLKKGVIDYNGETYKEICSLFSINVRNHEESIDVSRFGLTPEEWEEINQHLHFDLAESFAFKDIQCYYSLKTGKTNLILPVYYYSASYQKKVWNIIDDEINSIISRIPSSCTEVEKVMMLNDIICSEYAYALEISNECVELYPFVETHKGLCQAYCHLFRECCQRMKIETGYICADVIKNGDTKHPEGHIWNQVKVDGKWYNMDVTWNDPINYHEGKVHHKFALLSDAMMVKSAKEAKAVYTNVEAYRYCDSERFASYLWDDFNYPMVYKNGKFYLVIDSCICEADINKNTYKELYEINDIWGRFGKNGYILGTFSGLAAYGDVLIFNTHDKLMTFDPATGKTETLFKPEGITGSIYGFLTDEELNVEILYTNELPYDQNMLVKNYKLPALPVSIEYGDVNGDGDIDSKDLLALSKYISGQSVANFSEAAADVNCDGEIDMKDVLVIKKYIASLIDTLPFVS